MAVWMQIFGKNNFSSDIETIEKKLLRELENITIDLTFLKNKIYPEISYFGNNDEKLQIKINNLPENYYEYSNKWQIRINHNEENDKYLIINYPLYDNNAGIRVDFFNDVIMLTGLFDHFSKWFMLTEDKKISDGYVKIAEKVFSIFDSTNLYLCSEWCICGEEFNLKFSEFTDYINNYPETVKSEIENLESHEICILEIK
jgi:hypothetical protein